MTAGRLAGLLKGEPPLHIAKLHGDGSARSFFRVTTAARTMILMEGPDEAENAAYVRIAKHLANAGVRVPEIYGFVPEAGLVLMEDLGDRNLLAEVKSSDDPVKPYAGVLELLVRMQVKGARGFVLETGFASAPYGPRLMVEGEGLYFVREFAAGYLGLAVDEPRLMKELEAMASLAAQAPAGYFLHRDFQSRNIHLAGSEWAVIDFQGARPGPLAYDAAALIMDPYAGLEAAAREALWNRYFALLEGCEGVDAEAVRRSSAPIGAFRLMQALGAFGKLGGRQGKPGFLEHSGAALTQLRELLESPECSGVRGILGLVSLCTEEWLRRNPGAE